ncbi:MAG: zinc-ribbon domain-containing protein, partial [bacterium]|nr:zinc-ribbon domain-containing protein [bacterium]
IPCFKWNRQYYVQTSCCHTLFELDPDVGEDILYDEKVEILPKHLTRIKQGSYCGSCKSCKNCGYETSEDFEFCPKCGERF